MNNEPKTNEEITEGDAMNAIKFSHQYLKMPTEADGETPVSSATLLAVFVAWAQGVKP